MTRKRNIARKGAIGGLIAGLACAALPMTASAQTATSRSQSGVGLILAHLEEGRVFEEAGVEAGEASRCGLSHGGSDGTVHQRRPPGGRI